MTDGPVRIQSGELPVDELVERVEAGQRVIIEREMLGTVHEITLRFDGDIYYCDTPTTLHRHETVEGMRQCLTDHRYASD